MPTISVRLLSGRTAYQKAQFANEVTKAAIAILGADKHAISIEFHEVDRSAIDRTDER